MDKQEINILVVGDCHFKVTNIPECEEYSKKLIEKVKERDIEFVVMLGDLLDTHNIIDVTPLNKIYELIDQIRKIRKIFIIVGNHDMVNNQVYLSNKHWMNGLKEWENITIVDKVIEYKGFVFIPYVFPGKFIEALDTLEGYDWKKARCIFAHQEFYGCKMGAIKSNDGDKWDKDYPNVISGHIHSTQKIDNIYYIGSSMQIAYGETSKAIIGYVTFIENENEYKLEEIELDLPKKKIIYTDIEKIEDYKIEDSRDKVKISLSGDYNEFKTFKNSKKYKELVNSGIKVVFKQKKKEIKVKNEKIQQILNDNKNNTEVVDFHKILSDLVYTTNDEYLIRAYKEVINI